jgi:hypothetical protein
MPSLRVSDRLPGLPSPTAFAGVIQRTGLAGRADRRRVRAAGADSIALERIETTDICHEGLRCKRQFIWLRIVA